MTAQGWAVVVPTGFRVGPYRVDAGIATGSWGSVYAATLVEDPVTVDGTGVQRDVVATSASAGVPTVTNATISHASGHWPSEAALKFLPAGRLTPAQRGMIGELVDREVRFGEQVAGRYLVRLHAVLEIAATETGRGFDDPNSSSSLAPNGSDGTDPCPAGVDGAVVLVMERARHNVRDVLEEGELATAVPDAPRLLAQLAEAMDSLHEQGWVHADLKPENLLVMRDGSLRVADFGLSAELEGTHAYVPNLGSTDYLPPEWWNEQLAVRGVAVRPAGDVWAYGVIAHELLTGGQHPFPGATARARSAAVRETAADGGQPRLNARLTPAWRDLVADCLLTDPTTRMERTRGLTARVRDLANVPALEEAAEAPGQQHPGEHSNLEEIDAAGRGLPTEASYAAGPPANQPDARRRRGRWWTVAAASVLALLVGIGGTTWMLTRTDESDQATAGSDGSRSASPQARAAGDGPPYPPRAGDLRSDAAVPSAYREQIIHAGRNCPEHKSVTPALVAGIVAAESGFDADKRSPQTNEYGIAMWTPHLLKQWVPGGKAMQADDSIRGLGRYLCWAAKDLAGRDELGTAGPRLLAASYRTSTDKVAATGGVPDEVASHVAEVEHKRRAYAAPR